MVAPQPAPTISGPLYHPKCKRRRLSNPPPRIGGLVVGLLFMGAAGAQIAPSPRWGQAVTLAGTTLFMQGGKVDPSNSYSYTSAPNTNDLFSLDLSTKFDLSNPPWKYMSGSQDLSTSQGPAVAFHTLSAYSNKRALLFGGDGGPTLPIETNPDSAWLLQFWDGDAVAWTQEPITWAQQPMRRMYHSAAVSDKEVWITGGQKADGSGIGFEDVYVFDGSGSSGSFTNLTSEDDAGLPLPLVGHRSVILPDGTLLVIGGYLPSESTLLPMSTIFYVDTNAKTPIWSNFTVQGQTPSPRRNFAIALLDNNKILIHGGGDGTLQTMYSDGAVLDMNMQPPSWVAAPALVGTLGARVDHIAVGMGDSVLIGYGRGQNAPARAGLFLYNTTADSFGTSFDPEACCSAPTPTQTVGYTTGPAWPTSSITGLIPGQSGTTHPPQSTGTVGGDGGNSADENKGHSSKKVVTIALATILGASAALALAIIGIYFYLRRHRGDPKYRRLLPFLAPERYRFGSGDTEDPVLPGARPKTEIPVAGARWSDQSRSRGILGMLSVGLRHSSETAGSRAHPQRVDMLQDEDERDFGHLAGPSASTTTSGPPRPAYRRFGSSTRQLWNGVINASTTSLKAAGTALRFGGQPGTPEVDTENKSPDWWEKTSDPFADDAVALANLPSVTAVGMGAAARQRGGTTHSQYPSYGSASSGYRDPFTDSIGHSRTSTAGSRGQFGEIGRSDSYHPFMMPLDDPPPPSSLITPAQSPPPIDTSGIHRNILPGILTPGTLTSSDTLHPVISTPTTETTRSSGERSTSPLPGWTSLLGSAPTTPMKRSESWWQRFGRTSLTNLSRQGSQGDRLNPIRRLSLRNSTSRSPTEGYAALDFRDPNPPPKLEGIEETGNSQEPSPENGEKPVAGPSGPVRNFNGVHSKSLSSFQTADSEALEKMGRYDVIQRGRTASSDISTEPADSIREDFEFGTPRLAALRDVTPASSRRRPTRDSSDGVAISPESAMMSPGAVSSSASTPGSGTQETYITARTQLSKRPTRESPADSFATAQSSMSPPAVTSPGRNTSVANRVAIFEEMAQTTSPVSSPTSPEFRDKPGPLPRAVDQRKSLGGVRYGLTERPSLFVANPDRRSGTGSTAEDFAPTPTTKP